MNYWLPALILIAAMAVIVAGRRAHRKHSGNVRLDAGVVSQQWLAESRREEEA